MINREFQWHEASLQRVLVRLPNLPHAILLHGPQGIGKLQFALSLAQNLVCERRTATGPCGECTSCIWFSTSSHPDFCRIEPGGSEELGDEAGAAKDENAQITVDQVRKLSDFLGLSTHRGGHRVVLLHPAERLNVNAANALLKSLEEPPSRTVFLLVSHRPHHLLATIKSRCEMLPLQGPTEQVAVSWLKSQGVANPALAAAHSGNAPLLALQWTTEDYWQPRRDFLNQLQQEHFDPIATAERTQGSAVPQVLSWLQKWSYDLAAQKLLGRIRYNPDYTGVLASLADRVDSVPLLRFHREMVRLQRSAHHPLNARLFLENAVFSYADLIRRAAAV